MMQLFYHVNWDYLKIRGATIYHGNLSPMTPLLQTLNLSTYPGLPYIFFPVIESSNSSIVHQYIFHTLRIFSITK